MQVQSERSGLQRETHKHNNTVVEGHSFPCILDDLRVLTPGFHGTKSVELGHLRLRYDEEEPLKHSVRDRQTYEAAQQTDGCRTFLPIWVCTA